MAPLKSAARVAVVSAPGVRRLGRKFTAKLAPTYVVVPNVRRSSSPWSHQRSRRRGGAGVAAAQAGPKAGSGAGSGGGGGVVAGLLRIRLERAGHVAELLAGLEADREPGRDLDLLGRTLGVPADAALSGLDEKHAEAAQLDAFAAGQRLAHDLDDRLDGLRGFLPRHVGHLGDAVDDVVLDHVSAESTRSGPC